MISIFRKIREIKNKLLELKSSSVICTYISTLVVISENRGNMVSVNIAI